MTSLLRRRTSTASPSTARRSVVAATSLMLMIVGLAQNVHADGAERIEGALFSPAMTIGLSAGWGITTYRLVNDPDEYYGSRVGNEEIHYYTDHLHLGYGLYMVGFLWRREFPSSYRGLPYGARLLFCSGSLIELDDMYQHLVLHKHDDFNAREDPNGTIAESPIHRLYVAAEQTRRTEDYKIMLDLFLADRLTLAVGYYQGMAAEASYRVHDFGNFRGVLSLKCIAGIGIIEGETKRLGLEQAIVGAGLNLYLTDWCSVEVGSGLRLYSANPRLGSLMAVFYGMEFGPRP